MFRTILAAGIFFCLLSFARADYDSAVAALEVGDYENAFNEFKLLAEDGDAEAQNKLAMMFQRGMGIPQDPDAALQWYQKAAEGGFSPAQLNLGAMYRKGVCIPPDYPEASRWYRKAAEQGVSEAQYNLGMMYFYGNGLPRDMVQAYAWVDIAANSGNERARDSLGVIIAELDPAGLDQARKLAIEYGNRYGYREQVGDTNTKPEEIISAQ